MTLEKTRWALLMSHFQPTLSCFILAILEFSQASDYAKLFHIFQSLFKLFPPPGIPSY